MILLTTIIALSTFVILISIGWGYPRRCIVCGKTVPPWNRYDMPINNEHTSTYTCFNMHKACGKKYFSDDE